MFDRLSSPKDANTENRVNQGKEAGTMEVARFNAAFTPRAPLVSLEAYPVLQL